MTQSQFETLLTPVYPELVRYARSMAGSKDDGDDALQDALVKAWRSRARLRDDERFKPWLLRIIRNTVLSRTRTARFKRWLGLEAADTVAGPEELPFEDRELVRQSLSRLPAIQREALVLYEVLGMTVDEVAQQQQASRSAVKSRLSRGRSRLRAEVEARTRKEVGHEHPLAEQS